MNSSKIWQRNYYEHIIRDNADYERIAAYILNNPINWDSDEAEYLTCRKRGLNKVSWNLVLSINHR